MKFFTAHLLLAVGLTVLLVIVQSCTNSNCRASVELPGAIAGCVR